MKRFHPGTDKDETNEDPDLEDETVDAEIGEDDYESDIDNDDPHDDQNLYERLRSVIEDAIQRKQEIDNEAWEHCQELILQSTPDEDEDEDEDDSP